MKNAKLFKGSIAILLVLFVMVISADAQVAKLKKDIGGGGDIDPCFYLNSSSLDLYAVNDAKDGTSIIIHGFNLNQIMPANTIASIYIYKSTDVDTPVDYPVLLAPGEHLRIEMVFVNPWYAMFTSNGGIIAANVSLSYSIYGGESGLTPYNTLMEDFEWEVCKRELVAISPEPHLTSREKGEEIEMETAPVVSPNPTSGDIRITFRLAEEKEVTIAIYNTLGQPVKSIIVDEILGPGDHILEDSIPEELPKGIYYMMFQMDDEVMVEPIMNQ